MKTWLSIFLPKDEYKERQMLVFLAEAAVLQVILVLALLIINAVIVPMTTKFIFVICLYSIILYAGGRYIFSGIEYTEITTEKEYKNQVKILQIKSIGFFAVYLILAILLNLFGVYAFFEGRVERIEFFGVLALAAIFLFVTQFISLRNSYMKNKDLM